MNEEIPTPVCDEVAQYLKELGWPTNLPPFAFVFERLADLQRQLAEAKKELRQIESLMFGGFLEDTMKDGLAWRLFDKIRETQSQLADAKIEIDGLRSESARLRGELRLTSEQLADEWALADRLAYNIDVLLEGYDDASEIAPFSNEAAHTANRAIDAWKQSRNQNTETK